MKKITFVALAALILASCQAPVEKTDDQPLIVKNEMKLESDIMTPEVLWAFGRLGDVQVSPDREKILYGVSYYSVEQNKSNRELFVMNADGSEKIQLTSTPQNEFNAVWHPDGEKIVYISAASGELQAWEMNADGSGKNRSRTWREVSPDLYFLRMAGKCSIRRKYRWIRPHRTFTRICNLPMAG